MPRRVTVFAGSASGASPAFAQAATELGTQLASAGTAIVYGGAQVGLMGALADAALAAGGEVIGVIPRSLVDRELAHPGLSRLDVVADMHERKQRMTDLADAFVALPGGAGTLDELFEVWTWQQLGLHTRPVALYDVDGFWGPLRVMIDAIVDAGFLAGAYRDALVVANTPAQLMRALDEWMGVATKWAPREGGRTAG